MPSIVYELDSEDELDALWESDEDTAALVDELLCQFEESPALLEELCREDRHVNHDPSFQVKRFKCMWNCGYTVYILKVWPKEGREIQYRILYAHHPQKDTYYVLHLMQRGINYDADKKLVDKLIRACEEIGIPRYR